MKFFFLNLDLGHSTLKYKTMHTCFSNGLNFLQISRQEKKKALNKQD